MLLHGITFGGHPVAAAIALRNIEIFEREGVLENVRAHEGYLRRPPARAAGAAPDRRRRARRGLLLGARARPRRASTRFSADERERLLRGFLTGRLLEEGLIARPDDRGDAVLHLAPPLICGEPRARRDGREDRGGPRRRLGALLRRVKHDAHGWWLAEAGAGRAGAAAARRRARRRRDRRRRLRGPVDRVAAAAARRERRAAGGGRVRPRAERAQRRLRRDAVDEPAGPRRALRGRARARRRARVGGQRRRRSAPGARRRASTPGSRRAASCSPPPPRPRTRCWTGCSRRPAPPAPRTSCAGLDRAAVARALRLAALPPRGATRPATPPCTRRGSRSGCATA